MLSQRELQSSAVEWGVSETTVEKDYVLESMLRAIVLDQELADAWIITRGNCIRKCFSETWRFPDNLHFISQAAATPRTEDIRSYIDRIMKKVTNTSQVNFSLDEAQLMASSDRKLITVDIYFHSFLDSAALRRVHVILDTRHVLLEQTIQQRLRQTYTDNIARSIQVLSPSVPELFAQEIEALAEEASPEDLYDLVHLFWQYHGSLSPEHIKDLLRRRGEARRFPPISFETIAGHMHLIQRQWNDVLSTQVRSVPPFEHFWGALQELIAWMDGMIERKRPPAINIPDTVDVSWNPPGTMWHWGIDVPLESIRFAAVNRLCIELGYGGSVRLVEPYSLRFTQEGNILLCARKVETQEIRTYRVDRIESIRITNIPFVPVFTIEMTAGGPMMVQPPLVPISSAKHNH